MAGRHSELARLGWTEWFEERALCLLDLVGIADHAYQLPSHLSGGQQQSAAIARALANDPKILVTDEPTGNLDSRTAEQVFDLLTRLVADGKTVLMVTHDDDLARRASRVVTIKDGEILDDPQNGKDCSQFTA